MVDSEDSRFSDSVIEEKVLRLAEADPDAAFAEMAHDPNYQRNAIELAHEFEKSDWEAFTLRAPHWYSDTH
jgi:hypothetical protein